MLAFRPSRDVTFSRHIHFTLASMSLLEQESYWIWIDFFFLHYMWHQMVEIYLHSFSTWRVLIRVKIIEPMKFDVISRIHPELVTSQSQGTNDRHWIDYPAEMVHFWRMSWIYFFFNQENDFNLHFQLDQFDLETSVYKTNYLKIVPWK